VPVWPARSVVVIGAVLVVASYAFHALRAVKVIVTGRDDAAAPAASTHL
jgi:hypothetical protein